MKHTNIFRGQVGLLRRTAHQAVLYCEEADSILIHAGYALGEDADQGQWLSDLVVINTPRCGLPYVIIFVVSSCITVL